MQNYLEPVHLQRLSPENRPREPRGRDGIQIKQAAALDCTFCSTVNDGSSPLTMRPEQVSAAVNLGLQLGSPSFPFCDHVLDPWFWAAFLCFVFAIRTLTPMGRLRNGLQSIVGHLYRIYWPAERDLLRIYWRGRRNEAVFGADIPHLNQTE
ncbi:hypothetical protein VTN02DRAFT_851 [Thermoascus thermophilus]